MKQAVLTGISTEHKFNRLDEGGFDSLGKAQFFLVFNDGELRVPISEEAAMVVIRHYAKEQAAEDAQEVPQNGADPGAGEPVVTSFNDSDDDSDTDEDGVSQI